MSNPIQFPRTAINSLSRQSKTENHNKSSNQLLNLDSGIRLPGFQTNALNLPNSIHGIFVLIDMFISCDNIEILTIVANDKTQKVDFILDL